MRMPTTLTRAFLAGLLTLGVLSVSACSFTDEPRSEAATSGASATPNSDVDDTKWKVLLSTDFSGSALEPQWQYRLTGIFDAKGRHCAAPSETNTTLESGKAKLAVSKETEPSKIAQARAAGCEEKRVLRNAMISTETKFDLQSGKVAARIKFPKAQGMHGGVWLQSKKMAEIDIIESYGYGKGITSVVHIDGKRTPAAGKDTYVLQDKVKDPAWWSEYHVYSVEWDAKEVVFRVDGEETQRLTVKMPKTDYFIVLSNLTSDWEQYRLTAPTGPDDVAPAELPETMSVDWVKAYKRVG